MKKCENCKLFRQLRYRNGKTWYNYCYREGYFNPCSGNLCDFPKYFKPIRGGKKGGQEMKIEEKQLLLQDLCARLPYGVKVEHLLHAPNNPSDLLAIDVDRQVLYCDHKGREEWYKIEFLKPYLRSMSSMTAEEQEEWDEISRDSGWGITERLLDECSTWLNEHHFDYRGLIEKGLALKAPKEMYGKEDKK